MSCGSRSWRGPFAERVIDDHVISDQHVEGLLGACRSNLHCHHVALSMSGAVRVRVDPFLVSFTDGALGVWLTEHRLQLSRSGFSFGDAGDIGRREIPACGEMRSGAARKCDTHAIAIMSFFIFVLEQAEPRY